MNRVCSIFSQLLQLFSRVEFETAVRQHKAERHARGFTCWGQFVAMLFCQLGRAHSLREICQGLAARTAGPLSAVEPPPTQAAYEHQHETSQGGRPKLQMAHSGRRKFRFLAPKAACHRDQMWGQLHREPRLATEAGA
jgi:hypothetical protein